MITRFENNADGLDLSIPSEILRRHILKLDDKRQCTSNELHIIDRCLNKNALLDCTTKNSVQPPELRVLIREVCQHYWWFYLEKMKEKIVKKQSKLIYILPIGLIELKKYIFSMHDMKLRSLQMR